MTAGRRLLRPFRRDDRPPLSESGRLISAMLQRIRDTTASVGGCFVKDLLVLVLPFNKCGKVSCFYYNLSYNRDE